MAKYTPITAQAIADALGLWDSGDEDEIPGAALAAAMLAGDEPFEAEEVAKIAAHVGLTVDELSSVLSLYMLLYLSPRALWFTRV